MKTIVAVFSTILVLVAYNFYSFNNMANYNEPLSWPFQIGTALFAKFLRTMADRISPLPPFKVIEDIFGNPVSEVIYVCTKLGISDILKDDELTVEELSRRTNVTKIENLRRLLRAAEAFGYFQEDLKTFKWSNNKLSV